MSARECDAAAPRNRKGGRGEVASRVSLAAIVPIVVLAFPVGAGLIGVLLPAFGYLPALGGRSLSLDPWARLFAEPGITRSLGLSFFTGLATAGLSLATVLLFLGAYSGTRFLAVMRRLISPLLAVPHAAAAFGFAFLIAPSGLLIRAVSPELTGWLRPPDVLILNDPDGLAMMAGLVMKEIPFLLLMSLAALPQIEADARLRVARGLGYAPLAAWLKVVVPALYPLLRLPVYAVIAYASSVVDVALILGPSNPPPLSVAVLRWQNDPDLALRFVASAGALTQAGVTFSALLSWRLGEIVVSLMARDRLVDGRRRLAEPLLAGLGAGGMGLAAVVSLAGLVGLAIASVAGYWRFPDALPRDLTLAHWTAGILSASGPMLTTVVIGLAATALSLAIAIAALENEIATGRRAGAAAMRVLYLPLVVPPVAFLFGLVTAAAAIGARPGLGIVVLGHVVFVLPYVYLSLSEPYRRLDPRYAEIAASLGASRAKVFFQVRLPMLLAPCLTAVAVGFAVSVGQYLATQLLGAGRTATITTEAVALASGGERRIIGVYALMQAILPAIGFGVALLLPRYFWRNRALMRDAP